MPEVQVPVAWGAARVAQGGARVARLWLGALLCLAALLVGRAAQASSASVSSRTEVMGAPSMEASALRRIVKLLGRDGPRPERLAEVLALVSLRPVLPPGAVFDALAPVAHRWLRKKHQIDGPGTELLRVLLRDVALRAGRSTELSRWRRPDAALRAWSWLGPFDAAHGSSFDRVSSIERSARLLPSYVGRDGPVSWALVSSFSSSSAPASAASSFSSADLRLDGWVERPGAAVVYVGCEVFVSAPVVARLGLSTLGRARVWVDGQRAIEHEAPSWAPATRQGLLLPQRSGSLSLASGWHRLIVKLASGAGGLGLRLSLRGPNGGAAFSRQRALVVGRSSREIKPITHSLKRAGLVGEGGWARALLKIAAAPERGRASIVAAREALRAVQAARAHGLWLPSEVSLALSALASSSADPEVGRAQAAQAPEVGDRISRLRVASARAPADLSTLVDLAESLDEMGKTSEAHRLWEGFARAHGDPAERSIRACVLRIELWSRLSAELASLGQARRCLRLWPRSPLVLARLARVATARDDLAWAAVLRARGAALEPGGIEAATRALVSAISAGSLPAARRWVDKIEGVHPHQSRALEALARAELGAGQVVAARASLDRLVAPLWRLSTLALSARVAVASGDRARALAALRRALRAAPARADLRARLRLLEPVGDFFQSYRRDLIAEARARLHRPRRHPLQRQLRQAVIRVLGGGRQARYEAEVIEIGPGGPRVHVVNIAHDPSQSHVEILRAEIVRADGHLDRGVRQRQRQLGEEQQGLYYDLEELELTFSDLHPGDILIVEVVTRDFVGDPFGLVFGELYPLAHASPVQEVELILQLPLGTPLHARLWDPIRRAPLGSRLLRSRLASPASAAGSRQEWDVWRLHLGSLPALLDEDNAPGESDLSPYLHISSFASWQEVASWYAGLVRQSLPPKGSVPELSQLAHRLTQGREGMRQKVRAIYRYVADELRYVGLEFGIHSLKPHDARAILRRQFGDCKDKALLLVALLAEVEIEAELVLVRTAAQGGLEDGVASLGVFDHAIAYVPALDRWLDATASAHAYTELPQGDAGAMALRIPRGEATAAHTLVRLPVREAAENLRLERGRIRLSSDGAAELELSIALTGLPAAQARSRLHAEASRKERLEEELSRRFGGLSLSRIEVSGIAPVAERVEIKVWGRVPGWAAQGSQGLSLRPLRPQRPLVETLASASTRIYPLVLPMNLRSEQHLQIIPPPGWKVSGLPPSSSVVEPFGRFSLRAEAQPAGSLVLHKVFERRQRVLRPVDYLRFRSWLQKVDLSLGFELRLSPGTKP